MSTASGQLVYELRVPLVRDALHPHGIGANIAGTVGVGLETSKFDPAKMRERVGGGMQTPGGQDGGTPPGDGGGGMPPGGGMGGGRGGRGGHGGPGRRRTRNERADVGEPVGDGEAGRKMRLLQNPFKTDSPRDNTPLSAY